MLGRFMLYGNNLENKLDAGNVSAYSLSHRAAIVPLIIGVEIMAILAKDVKVGMTFNDCEVVYVAAHGDGIITIETEHFDRDCGEMEYFSCEYHENDEF
ncbi:hypothetical protein A54_98 [Septuagintavirus sv54]|uniref:Uncharacterized protein n=1 Tax=Escherichia phage A5-4 TaxID=2996162 RepID=A0AAE9Q207_9CAUD|nr:hypothetical protein A54_98 [Escherichia phage A5-4]